MNKSIPRGLLFLSLVGCLMVSLSQAKQKPPTNWDGLEIRKVKGLDLVYVRPNVEFTPYKSVLLDPVHIEFAKNWEKNQRLNTSPGFRRPPSAEDMQNIKTGLSDLMQEVFTEELTKHGYTIVSTPTDETLHVRTAIINLWINAPDTSDPGITRTYTTSAGSMTLVLEARDGPTGQLLARVVDERSDDNMGRDFQWTTKASNTQAARQSLQAWAKRLRESLDKLNGKTEK